MIRTFLEFDLAPGKADGFVAFFERNEILATSVAQPGCRSAELTISDDGLRALVTALWEGPADYEKWTSRDDRGDLAVELNTFLATDIGSGTVGRVFRVALTGD